MRWVLLALAAFVKLGVDHFFFTEFRGDVRLCSNCSYNYGPSATHCPRCGTENPNVSPELNDEQ